MKVLQINSVYRQGSTGKIAYALSSLGSADGLTMAVCYGRGPSRGDVHAYKFGLDWETYFHALMTRITGLTGFFSCISTYRLLRYIDRFQPDIVHIHEMHAYFVNLEPVFSYLARHHIPVVHTFHCEFAYTGKCGYTFACEHWKTGCGHCPRLREYPKTLLFDWTSYMYRKKQEMWSKLTEAIIVSPSNWLARRVEQTFLMEHDIRVIPNGIDTEQIFHPQPFAYLRERHRLREEKIVLAVALLLMSPIKGGHWVVELAKRMSAEKIKFILIGVENSSEPFPKNVIALERTENQQELAAYYSMADCFVICSERENLPTTCLEAYCCGTPVAGFDTGGCSETVPEPYGRFTPYGDLPALEQSVRNFLWSADLSSDKIVEAARSRYSEKVMYQAYHRVYEELMLSRVEYA